MRCPKFDTRGRGEGRGEREEGEGDQGAGKEKEGDRSTFANGQFGLGHRGWTPVNHTVFIEFEALLAADRSLGNLRKFHRLGDPGPGASMLIQDQTQGLSSKFPSNGARLMRAPIPLASSKLANRGKF